MEAIVGFRKRVKTEEKSKFDIKYCCITSSLISSAEEEKQWYMVKEMNWSKIAQVCFWYS